MEFYRDVFPIGSFENSGEYEQGKANGILCSIKDKKGQNQLIFDDLEEIKNHVDDDFVLLSLLHILASEEVHIMRLCCMVWCLI